jgi:hypothetical protein
MADLPDYCDQTIYMGDDFEDDTEEHILSPHEKNRAEWQARQLEIQKQRQKLWISASGGGRGQFAGVYLVSGFVLITASLPH